jgi:hypothetical protein
MSHLFFCKLGSINLPPPIKKDFIIDYGTHVNGKFIGISYFSIDPQLENHIIQTIIPTHYQHLFNVLLMEINSDYIPPHTDSYINCVINIYIDTNDATTIFHLPKKNYQNKSFKIKNQTDGNIFDKNSLEKICSFKAKPNDIWLLNVKLPHSVISKNTTDLRIAYSIQTNMDYESVKKIFN